MEKARRGSHWTVDSAREMADWLSSFGERGSDSIRRELVAPLLEEDEALADVERTRRELTEAESRLQSMNKGETGSWDGQQE